ncbi:RNA polymerase sigma factor [candidate division CSSED10-310 bacterium]|uniref:RNA polymerase sigma factor n=1 Tax=candidate division CSSED10-310 bacterium TaxID=2855610 RepID=A0ABV6Z3F7_UNCC1
MRFNDEELMVLFASGTKEAFDMLYERHRHGLYRFARSCLKCSADAEDVVQDVFIRVSQAAARYHPRGRFKSWLYQIAVNRIRTRVALNKRGLELQDSGPSAAQRPTSGSVEHSIILHDLLHKSMLLLSENQKMILFLKEVEGMKYEQIGRTLDLTPENVRVLIHRARKQISSFIHQEQGDNQHV